MRAVSRDYDAASLMGIDLNRTIAITFFHRFGAGGRGRDHVGHEIHAHQSDHRRDAGHQVLHRGGARRHRQHGGRGARRSADRLSSRSSRSRSFPALSGYRDAFAFVVLILVLLVKPTGLLGEKTTEKV